MAAVALLIPFETNLGGCCCVLKDAGHMKGMKCDDVIRWAKDANLAKSAVGLATINALLQEDIKDYRCDNIFDNLQVKPEDTLGVVGDFGPFLRDIRKQVKDMYVFEKKYKRCRAICTRKNQWIHIYPIVIL